MSLNLDAIVQRAGSRAALVRLYCYTEVRSGDVRGLESSLHHEPPFLAVKNLEEPGMTDNVSSMDRAKKAAAETVEKTRTGLGTTAEKVKEASGVAAAKVKVGAGVAAEKVKAASGIAASKVKETSAKAGAYARERAGVAGESLRQGYGRARKDLERLGEDVSVYVRDNPGKSVLMAGALGFFLGLMIRGGRRR